jgi:carbamoyltransferase
MDGLDAICQAHGRTYEGASDRFYTSAVDHSIRYFRDQGVTATYFLIARDLDHREKRASVDALLSAGHRIACHSLTHRYLDRLPTMAEKRAEIVDAKHKIEDELGVAVEGFRAPGYSIDFESLELLRDAGYRYDSSIFPSFAMRRRIGVQRLFREPFLLFPEERFFEIPMPYVGPALPPFHPCYAFYLSRAYFRWQLRAFARRHDYLTLLFHLTDFAESQRSGWGTRINVYTNNYLSARRKRRFLARLARDVRRFYSFANTEELLRDWPASMPGLSPRTILGIATTHETGACIVRDGRVLSAINEERLTRRKLDNRYPPERSIREAIRIASVPPTEIEAVAIAGLHASDLAAQSWESFRQDVRDFHAWNDYFPHFCRVLYRLFYFWRATRYERVRSFLRREYGISPKIFYVEHHEAHAACAYRASDTSDALVMTADGVGDDVCVTYSHGLGTTIRRVETLYYPNSFGQFYTACTQVLGFKAGRHEGKITGLAGYGSPNPELIEKVERTFFTGDGFRLNKRYYSEGFIRFRWSDLGRLIRGELSALNVDHRNYKPPLARLLRGYKREEIAYAFQSLLEREAVRLTKRHVNGTAPRLALAGGVFANVRLNMALSRELDAESIFIYPAMGDGGLCVGAALSVAGEAPVRAESMLLGTAYAEEEVDEVLTKHPELVVERPQNMARAVARALADKKIVARFDGRMEFGPRALGNRSILYHAGDRTVNDWLNAQLRRTEFMPFAPICIWEDAEEYFDVREGEKHACEFMTLVVSCTDRMRETSPAAVHVDGTARPQLVRREINPGMYDILVEYKRLTGLAVMINTSFNMHEEPIVRSPEEAIAAFQQSHLHYLVLGPFLVRPREQR